MGKSQKAQEEGFNLLEESTQAKKEDTKLKKLKKIKKKRKRERKKKVKIFAKNGLKVKKEKS